MKTIVEYYKKNIIENAVDRRLTLQCGGIGRHTGL